MVVEAKLQHLFHNFIVGFIAPAHHSVPEPLRRLFELGAACYSHRIFAFFLAIVIKIIILIATIITRKPIIV